MKMLLRKIDKPLLFITIAMFLFGLVMILSASYVRAFVVTGNAYQYLIRQGLILIMCVAIFIVGIGIPTNVYKKLARPVLYIIIGSLVAIFIYGSIKNGAKSWFDLGFFNYQPSEFAKTALILFMGAYYQHNKNNKDNTVVALTPILYMLLICFLVFAQPDLGTMLIILGITLLTFISVPLDQGLKRKIYYAFFGGVILLGIIVLLAALNGNKLLTTTQSQRFNFLEPCKRYMEAGTGYQVCNGYIAINNGGLFGVGIGNSTQKYLYLPEAHTDFIFPVIIEELGLVAGIIILLIYAYIIYRILYIARKSSTLMGSVICYGVAMYIFMHVFVNLVGVLGILPLTGVPLPFLSYGGCYALNIAICITMVERIAIETYNYRQDANIRNKIKGK